MKTIKAFWDMVREADAATTELIPYFGEQGYWVMAAGIAALGIVLFI